MNALIVVDMQRDFMPGGPLGVPEGDTLVPLINQLMEEFPLVVATKDWHPKDHISFAANHPDKEVGELIEVEGAPQVLWPTHCVQDTLGSDFAAGLHTDRIDATFFKGSDREVDSYSAFFDNAKKRDTGLDHYLRKKGVTAVAIVGVATDYCIRDSALDARSLGWNTTLILDGCKPINLNPGDEEEALDQMRTAGVVIATGKEVLR